MVCYGAHAWMQPSPFTGHSKCSNNFFFRAVRHTVKYDYIIKCAFLLFIPVFCVKQGLNYLNSAWPHAWINNALEKCQQLFVFLKQHSSRFTIPVLQLGYRAFSFCVLNFSFFKWRQAAIVMFSRWTFPLKKKIIKESVCLLNCS